MSDVASRELRNETRAVLQRVEAGEQVTITVDGRPVAPLRPIASRARWMPRRRFAEAVLSRQSDAGLVDNLRAVTGDETTDDLPLT